MSSSQHYYLGGYLQLPSETNWYDLTEQLDIVDQLCRVEVKGQYYYISNYNNCNLIKDVETQCINMTNIDLVKMEVVFLAQHKETIRKIEQYFNTKIEVQFGLVSYVW